MRISRIGSAVAFFMAVSFSCLASSSRPFSVSLLPRIAPILFITLKGTAEFSPYSFFSLVSRNLGIDKPQLRQRRKQIALPLKLSGELCELLGRQLHG